MAKVKVVDDNELVVCATGLIFMMDETGTYHVTQKNQLKLPIRITACGKKDSVLSEKAEAVPRAQACPDCIRKSNGGVIPA
jgi:hypothetical protein